MDAVNQKIIQAVIAKANQVCPNSLALIGVYGSVATGDTYERSDLDLLILIEGDEGHQLATGFILEDTRVGYDIYCTKWSGLEYDAECHHAHLSKLMESQIVYVKNQAAYGKLCDLRARVKRFLESDARMIRVRELVNGAKTAFANACLREGIGQVRLAAFDVISCLLDAMMLYHGTYFKRGTKRTFAELEALPLDGSFAQTVRKAVACKEVLELRELLKQLILYAEGHIRQEKRKAPPSEALSGTYEEMYSNWRNKVEEAAAKGDVFASFMNLCSLQLMLSDVARDTEIGTFCVMDEYDPESLAENTKIFDRSLQNYEQAYRQAGIGVKRFADVDAFVADYLSR